MHGVKLVPLSGIGRGSSVMWAFSSKNIFSCIDRCIYNMVKWPCHREEGEKMKVMKSYRFNESEVFEIRDIADALGITDTDVLRLALLAFQEYGVCDALADRLDGCSDSEFGRYAGYEGLSSLLYRSARGGDVLRAVVDMVRCC